MNIAKLSSCLIVAVVLVLSAVAQAAGERIVTSDLLRLQRITEVDVADDGTRAVFTVLGIMPKAGQDADAARPKYEYVSHLYMIDLTNDRAGAVQLTHGQRRDRAVALAPDGRRVAFLREGEHDGGEDGPQSQVFILDLRGGEARQVTTLEHGVRGTPQWSPGGDALAVRSMMPMGELLDDDAVEMTWPDERPGRFIGDVDDAVEPDVDGPMPGIRAWLAANAAEDDPTVATRLRFQDEQSLAKEMRFGQLVVVDVASGDARQLTRGAHDHRSPVWMRDGRSIVYVDDFSGDVHPDRVQTNRISRVELETGETTVLLADPQMQYSSPRISRDGAVLAFVGESTVEPAYAQRQLGMAGLGGDREGDDATAGLEPVWLTDQSNYDRSVWGFRWAGDRGEVVFTAADRGGIPLMLISGGLLRPAELVGRDAADMPMGVYAFDSGGSGRGLRIVYAATTVGAPSTLRVRTIEGDEDREVFDANPWVADKAVSLPRRITVQRPDDTTVDGWIMQPVGLEEGETYPTVLEIHGGPSAMWGPGEFSMWLEFQLLTSWGYGVVYANPRGSGGYGYTFQKQNYQNWGNGPAGDVLAVLDLAMNESWVDTDRLVVTGGSYGGYLTAWIVGNDQRFKAAVAQRGVYDLRTFFGEGNAWQLVPWAFGGHPWEQRSEPILRRESPFTYVQRIRTPLLILHASQDLRTGVSQSEMLYRALKVMNKPVEYVRYPDAGHDLSRTGDPTQRMDRLNRILEFFDRYVGEGTGTAPTARAAAAGAPMIDTDG